MESRRLSELARSRGVRHSISVNGVTSVYYEYPSSEPTSATLVMVHGYRGNHRGLEAIAAGLTSYRVIIPDLPGFGESAALSSEHSVSSYAVWLHTFVRQLGLEKSLNLMGHSFGTLVVGTYATMYPVRSVSLVNPVSSPALEGPRALFTKLAQLYYRVANFLPAKAGDWLLRNKLAVLVMSSVMAKTSDKSLRSWIHKQHLDNFSDFATISVATEGYEASISTDLSKLAASIVAPVLVIAATLDDITSIEAQRVAFELYPRGSFQEIQGVGHLVHYEAPDQAAKFISNFLDGLS